MRTKRELSSDLLRKTFLIQEMELESIRKAEEISGIIGQDRAIAALQFGLETGHDGFNIYVAGLPRTGKMTAVRAFVEKLAGSKQAPDDWCYVHNFEDPYQPRSLRFPAGLAREFQQDVTKLMDKVRSEIPKALENEEFAAKREELIKAYETARDDRIEKIKKEVNQQGFALQVTPQGVLMIPSMKGKMLTDEELQELPPDVLESFKRRREAIESGVKKTLKSLRLLERATEDQIQELEKQQLLYFLGGLFEDLIEKYEQLPEVVKHLQALQNEIIQNRGLFKTRNQSSPFGFLAEDLMQRAYGVNVLISHAKDSGAPVIMEMNPSYNELFGRLEKENHFGVLYSDFTLIKPGALHRANGGYLVLQIEDVLKNPFSWDALKRAIRTRQIQMEEPGERYGFVSGKVVRPEPISLNLKVVLTGPTSWFYLLSAYDPDFQELFKVQADFAETMPHNEKNVRGFLSFLCTFCKREKIRSLDAQGVATLLEHAMRLAEDQQKLSTQFGVLADVLREADHWAQCESAGEIQQSHINKAIEQSRYRSGLVQERLMEKTIRGSLLIDTEGAQEGQVNGLSFIGMDHYAFGRPVRITASTAPGREGIIDIEREAKLGGPLHSKGVLILSGYLSKRYSSKQPLSLTARLVFEQSYSGVEGDSASSAELCALLSSLAGTPVEQGIAMTGSVNQHGKMQAIGGVNEKIEGFFDLCQARGLKGDQGVIIPDSNAQNLMLRKDVVEAVRKNMFHIWAVEDIDQAMEILTGIPAGTQNEQNEYPAGTLNHKIQHKLQEYARTMKEMQKSLPV